MMTREYPPEVYGGAGVHVTELVAQLQDTCATSTCTAWARCGPANPTCTSRSPTRRSSGANPALTTLSADLVMVNAAAGATVAHSHTWYAGLAGHLAAMLYGIPHVLTAHSLEPMRPWKAEQLGGGYRVSSWVERTAVEAADAVIAVSSGMREDVLATYPALDPNRVHVVRNGIDTEKWYPVDRAGAVGRWRASASTRHGPSSRSSAGSRGRRASPTWWRPRTGSRRRCSWCCAPGAPDTPEIAAEVGGAVEELASVAQRRVLGAGDAAG